jgi:hypothetical protein
MISVDAASAFWMFLSRRADDIDNARNRGSGPIYMHCARSVVRRGRPWRVSQAQLNPDVVHTRPANVGACLADIQQRSRNASGSWGQRGNA